MKKPSRGVRILAWYCLLGSLFSVGGFFVSMIGMQMLNMSMPMKSYSPLELIIPTAGIWIAWYVLRLKDWARKGIILFALLKILRLAIWLPEGIAHYQDTMSGDMLSGALWIVRVVAMATLLFNFLYIYFFMRPDVKGQFG